MVRTITQTRYQTTDGRVFDDKAAAEKHDSHAIAMQAVIDLLPKPPELGSDQFYQHDKSLVWHVREAFLRALIRLDYNAKPAGDVLAVVLARESRNWVGMALGRYLDGPADAAWFRLCCIDTDGREWQQPYYCTKDAAADRKVAVCINPNT